MISYWTPLSTSLSLLLLFPYLIINQIFIYFLYLIMRLLL